MLRSDRPAQLRQPARERDARLAFRRGLSRHLRGARARAPRTRPHAEAARRRAARGDLLHRARRARSLHGTPVRAAARCVERRARPMAHDAPGQGSAIALRDRPLRCAAARLSGLHLEFEARAAGPRARESTQCNRANVERNLQRAALPVDRGSRDAHHRNGLRALPLRRRPVVQHALRARRHHHGDRDAALRLRARARCPQPLGGDAGPRARSHA